MSNHQTIKPIDGYSEDIDWDAIYRTFHNPKNIAERIAFELDDHKAPLIFCGFPETAAYLATAAKLQFVDQSSVITQRTEERYPDINTVTEGDISRILKDTPTKNVVISCRLSAFWQTQQTFNELSSAILAHPRDQILIDFFDRDAVHEGMHIYYKTYQSQQPSQQPSQQDSQSHSQLQQHQQKPTGDWDFKQFDRVDSDNPPIQIANLDISYTLGSDDNNSDGNDMDFAYETQRAFFTKIDILNWCTRSFPNYEATLTGPLVEDDPSFLIKLSSI